MAPLKFLGLAALVANANWGNIFGATRSVARTPNGGHVNDAKSMLEATLGSFLPHRMHMRLEGAPDDYSDEKASIRNVATSVHEHMHFFQTLLTGYGHIMWDSHRQMATYVMQEWHRLPSAPDGRRRLPLAHAAKLSPKHLEIALAAHITAHETIRLGQARCWLDKPDATLAELGLRLVAQPWAANPLISVDEWPHRLQGNEILEGHAQYVEAEFLESVAGLSREEAWSRTTLPEKYYVALDWFVEQCGEDRRAEFPFICDLALQTSWDPPLPKTEEQWRASHPAWRFVRLTEVRRQMDRLLLGGPSEWSSRYDEYSLTLLKAAGFRSLSDVFTERLAAFRRKERLLRFEELMRAGMEFRARVPWCGANPVLDREMWQYMVNALRAPIVEISGSLCGLAFGDPEANSEIVIELQYQALAAQILGDFSQAAVREQALECAFSKFGISQGCEFQRSHKCSGRFAPAAGSPHPPTVSEDGTLGGCSFEMILKLLGFSSAELDVGHTARLPTMEELDELERQARVKKDGGSAV